MSETASHMSEFESEHEFESFEGKARCKEIQPAEKVSEVPVLVAGGWSEDTRSLEDVGQEIAERGRTAILVDHARHGGRSEDETDFPVEIAHKANTLLESLNELDIEQSDVIAHSEGALNAVLAARLNPDKFRNLILVAPAGMIGKDSILNLAGRFSKKIVRGWTKDFIENPKAAYRLNTGTPVYVGKNPAKAFREIQHLASCTIDEVLSDLMEAGINVSVIQSDSDQVFPADRIDQHIKLGENVDRYASIIDEKAGHDDLIIHPERTTRAAIQMIENFEETT